MTGLTSGALFLGGIWLMSLEVPMATLDSETASSLTSVMLSFKIEDVNAAIAHIVAMVSYYDMRSGGIFWNDPARLSDSSCALEQEPRIDSACIVG